LCRLVSLFSGRTDDGDHIFADSHANGTNKKQTAATKTLDTPNSGEGHADIDCGSGDRDEEGVVDTSVGKEGCAKVKDKVDTGKLLPGLKEDTGERPEAHAII
jgi:hypothetical protein